MTRVLRILLIGLAAVVALLVAAVIAAAIFFDANSYRSEIVAMVHKHTGRTLTLREIHLTLFPSLGLKIDDASLANAPGFGADPFATIGEIDIGVRLLPLLFAHKLEIHAIYLSQLKLNLERNARGATNWQGLFAAWGTTRSSTSVRHSAGRMQDFRIGAINVSGASIRYRDARSHADLRLDDFVLGVGVIQSGVPSKFRASFATTSERPAINAQVRASGRMTFDVATKRYAVQDLDLSVDATGQAIPGGEQRLKLSGDAAYDGRRGTLRLAGATANVAGVNLHAGLDVDGVGSRGWHFDGSLRVDNFSPRTVLQDLGINHYRPGSAGALKAASLTTKLQGTADSLALSDLDLKLDGTTLRGRLAVDSFDKPAAVFDLKVDAVDLDDYLPPPPSAAAGSVAARLDGADPSQRRVPVAWLDHYTADGRLSVGALVVHGVKLADVTARLAARAGGSKRLSLTSQLYGGRLRAAVGMLPSSTPKYTARANFTDVDVGALLTALAGRTPISGRGTGTFDLRSAGDSVAAMRRALAGNVAVTFTNGAVKGLDLGQTLRQAMATLGSGANSKAARIVPAAVTDFATLHATGKVARGVVTSKDLTVASPSLRVKGAGTIDLVVDRLDWRLDPTLVSTAAGQGGKALSQLRGVTIPVEVSGPFTDIHYRVDVSAALQRRAARALSRHRPESRRGRKHSSKGLDKQIDRGLRKLFGGQHK
ncbi:MAG TPA: AsmA family protein [Nevskiaceae bacterium]|nr:AsmA family protein [Nevskiaceae bacterium]